MRPFILGAMALTSAAALAAAAAPSLAQPTSPPRAEGRMGAGMDMPRRDPEAMMQRHAEHMRAVLQLRPDQEPALRALIEGMRPPADMRERFRQERQAMAKLSTPERLDRMRARMGERQAQFDRRAAAIKRFYAQLTPAQQKAFDAMGPMRGGRMGMGGRHGPGMMGHGGHGGPDGPGMGPRQPG